VVYIDGLFDSILGFVLNY